MRWCSAIVLACLLAGGVMAQEPEHMTDAARAADDQSALEQTARDVETQADSNTARITAQEHMTGNQDFVLKLMGILMPSFVLLMQLRLSKQVNGMKHELVEEVRKAALLQGAKNERESRNGKPKKVTKARES
jgi:hypothetical protein